MSRLRPTFPYFFLAPGGIQIGDCAIGTTNIMDSAVTAAKLGDTAVTTAKINNSAVTYAKIQNVTAARLLGRHDGAAGVVQEIALAGGLTFDSNTGTLSSDTTISFTIADSQIDSSALADSAVSTLGLQDSAVTSAKLGDTSVTTQKINNNAITASKLADSAVSTLQLNDSAVTTVKINDSAVTTAKLDNTAVTYAKIQDMTAQRLLGREDAAGGSPQEIALSSELRFDTNNDWLEISDSGVLTGLIADSAITSAKIADATIVAGDFADSAVTTAKINNGAVTLAKMDSGVTGRLFTFDSSTGAVTTVAVGTSGHVLTSNGTGNVPTFQAASGGTPSMVMSTAFETSGRFIQANSNGSIVFGTTGVDVETLGGSAGYASVKWPLYYDQGADIYAGSPTFSCATTIRATPTTSTHFWGLGQPTVATTGITLTVRHIGFKVVWSGGTGSLYATQADGTTENASSALTTVTSNDNLDLILKVNSSTSVDYYWRKNGGSLSSATNLTSNMPATTDNENTITFALSSDNTTGTPHHQLTSASYSR